MLKTKEFNNIYKQILPVANFLSVTIVQNKKQVVNIFLNIARVY